jgi:hypothetical protein
MIEPKWGIVRPKHNPKMQSVMSISINVRPLGWLETSKGYDALNFKNAREKFGWPLLRGWLQDIWAVGCSSANFYRTVTSRMRDLSKSNVGER